MKYICFHNKLKSLPFEFSYTTLWFTKKYFERTFLNTDCSMSEYVRVLLLTVYRPAHLLTREKNRIEFSYCSVVGKMLPRELARFFLLDVAVTYIDKTQEREKDPD